MDFITGIISSLFAFGILIAFLPIIGIIVLVFFILQRITQKLDVPALDLMDAKKLDQIVEKEISTALNSFLQSKGYEDKQIQETLIRIKNKL